MSLGGEGVEGGVIRPGYCVVCMYIFVYVCECVCLCVCVCACVCVCGGGEGGGGGRLTPLPGVL